MLDARSAEGGAVVAVVGGSRVVVGAGTVGTALLDGGAAVVGGDVVVGGVVVVGGTGSGLEGLPLQSSPSAGR